MDSSALTSALNLIIGLISPLFALVTTFPVNIIAAFMVAGLAFGIVRKLMKIFRKR